MRKVEMPEERTRYALLLHYLTIFSFILLILVFALYVSDVLTPVVKPGEISQYWGMRAEEYHEITGAPVGWDWITSLNHGDAVCLLGIAFLAAVNLICFISILPVYIRKKDKHYAVIIAVEILMLLLAASGIISVVP